MHQPSFWTDDIVKLWLQEAADTEKTFPAVRAGGYGSFWPDILHDPSEAYGWEADVEPRCKPTSEQITNYDFVALWGRLLRVDTAKLVWAQARGIPQKIVMHKHGIQSRSTLHKRLRKAYALIAGELNRGVDFTTISQRKMQAHKCSAHVANMFTVNK